MKRRPLLAILVCALAGGPIAPAAADDWQLVLSDNARRVEIDRASIFDSDRGTKVSWGRVVLSGDEVARSGYATVRALNRYDCLNRSFFTIKRVYLDSAGRVIREEAVSDTKPVMVARNSVDERMWREVCRPPSTGDLEKVADAAGRSAARAAGDEPARPAARPARTAEPVRAEVAAAPPRPQLNASATAAVPRGAIEARVDENVSVTPAALPMTAARRPVTSAEAPGPEPAAPASSRAAELPARASAPAAPPAVQARAPEVAPGLPAAAARAPQQAAVSSAAPAAARPAPEAVPAVALASPRPAPAAMAAALRARVDDAGWAYQGSTGPEQWGRLRSDWALCAEGQRQSPVDLREGIGVELEPVRFDYRRALFRLTDTGNTLQVSVGEGMGMQVRGRRYELTHFTLHRPAEMRIDGRAADMAVHFHHRDAEGRQAVVAVLLQAGGEASPLLQTLLNNLPLERGANYTPTTPVDLAAFLPASPAHFLLMGSLSTPPCTEEVLWVVMKTPVPMSDGQLAIFGRLHADSARPLQAANGRLILESR